MYTRNRKEGYDANGYDLYHDDYGHHHPRTYAQSNESYRADLKRRAQEAARREEAKLRQVKQQRCVAATKRECSECFMFGLIDPDDYICIVCRDGKEAVAPGWLGHWSHGDSPSTFPDAAA